MTEQTEIYRETEPRGNTKICEILEQGNASFDGCDIDTVICRNDVCIYGYQRQTIANGGKASYLCPVIGGEVPQ